MKLVVGQTAQLSANIANLFIDRDKQRPLTAKDYLPRRRKRRPRKTDDKAFDRLIARFPKE